MSQAVAVELPKSARERLEQVAKTYRVPFDALSKEAYDLLQTDFMQKDTTIPDQLDKLDYCSKVIKSRYTTRPLLEEQDNLIVLGLGRVRNTKSGGRRGEIYVAVEEEQKDKTRATVLRSVVFQGRDCDKINTIQPPTQESVSVYSGVKLGKFKNGDFIGDDRSIFGQPQILNVGPRKILAQLGIKECTIAESQSNLAEQEKTSTGSFTKNTDWRIIRAMIGNYNKGQNKEGQDWGVYTISDDSLEEDWISPDGDTLIRKAFSVWVNPIWIAYEKGNELDFVGPLSFNPKDDKPRPISQTGFLLIPSRMPFGGVKP